MQMQMQRQELFGIGELKPLMCLSRGTHEYGTDCMDGYNHSKFIIHYPCLVSYLLLGVWHISYFLMSRSMNGPWSHRKKQGLSSSVPLNKGASVAPVYPPYLPNGRDLLIQSRIPPTRSLKLADTLVAFLGPRKESVSARTFRQTPSRPPGLLAT